MDPETPPHIQEATPHCEVCGVAQADIATTARPRVLRPEAFTEHGVDPSKFDGAPTLSALCLPCALAMGEAGGAVIDERERPAPFHIREPDGTTCGRVNRPWHAALCASHLGPGASVYYANRGVSGVVWEQGAARDIDEAAEAIVARLYELEAEARDESEREEVAVLADPQRILRPHITTSQGGRVIDPSAPLPPSLERAADCFCDAQVKVMAGEGFAAAGDRDGAGIALADAEQALREVRDALGMPEAPATR